MLAVFHNIFHPGIHQGKRIGAFIVDKWKPNIQNWQKWWGKRIFCTRS